jgi:hypothetical protein
MSSFGELRCPTCGSPHALRGDPADGLGCPECGARPARAAHPIADSRTPVFDPFDDDEPTDPLIRTVGPAHAPPDDDEEFATVVATTGSLFADFDDESATQVIPSDTMPRIEVDELDESNFDEFAFDTFDDESATQVVASEPPLPDPSDDDAATVVVMADAFLPGGQPGADFEPLPLIPVPVPEPPPAPEPQTYETKAPFAEVPPRVQTAPAKRKKPKIPRLHRIVTLAIGLLALTLALIVGTTLIYGYGYYGTPDAVRHMHPLDPVLRAGGPVGLLLGVGGTSLMVGMLIYSVRKAFLRVQWLGPMPLWLAFHIVCGIFGPLLIILHGGLALPSGLIAVGFWCMILVALSGVFGRYVYGHFPKTASGRASGLREAREELTELRAELVAQTPGPAGTMVGEAVLLARDFDVNARSLFGLVRLDFEVRRRARSIRRILSAAPLSPEVRRTATRTLMAQLSLKRSVETYDVAAHWLRLWHLFHLPLAQAMYLIVLIHVVEALLFGGALKTLRSVVGA